jgi:hypothetical protein
MADSCTSNPYYNIEGPLKLRVRNILYSKRLIVFIKPSSPQSDHLCTMKGKILERVNKPSYINFIGLS